MKRSLLDQNTIYGRVANSSVGTFNGKSFKICFWQASSRDNRNIQHFVEHKVNLCNGLYKTSVETVFEMDSFNVEISSDKQTQKEAFVWQTD